MSTTIWKNINYKTPIKYFTNTYIREYDLSKANINALLYMGRITQEEHAAYLNMDKQEREIKIGLWIKSDSSIYKDIQKGIIEAKRQLISSNNIEEFNIVSIKNDAVFVVGNELVYTEFPPFEFKVKNVYTMFLQLQNLEIYYADSADPSTGFVNTSIDVKGISDEALLLHQGGMLDLVCDICYKLQREDIRDTMKYVCDMYRLFISRSLPKQFYRNFDSFSGYTFTTFAHTMSLGEIDDSMINVVDINRNLSIIRDLVGIVSDIYHRQMR